MTVSVDELKTTLGCESDVELADRLGVERSTVAQWRRRNGVPARWHFILKAPADKAARLAARRRIFGDGDGFYIHMAALALLDDERFHWPMLTPHARGWQVEDWLLRVATYIIEVLGDRTCTSYEDYERLMAELLAEPHPEGLRRHLSQ